MKGHQRAAIEKHAIAARRNQKRHGCLQILLIQLAAFAAKIAITLFMRAEPEKRFVLRKAELQLRFEGVAVEDLFAGRGGGAHAIYMACCDYRRVLRIHVPEELLRR